MVYTVLKVLNNNALLLSHANRVYIGMGTGLGFGKRPKDTIYPEQLNKIFHDVDHQFLSKLSKSIEKLNEKYYSLVDEVVCTILEHSSMKISDEFYLTLAEHISFAEVRLDNNIEVPCLMENEIRVFYPQEYALAKEALSLIEKRLQRSFPKAEIGLIALHIINAKASSQDPRLMEKFELIQEIVRLIEQEFKIQFDQESCSYTRLITHLKFLCHRIFLEQMTGKESDLTRNIYFNESFKEAILCSSIIKEHIEQKTGYLLNHDEVNYLVIHIQSCLGENEDENQNLEAK